jgi:hypothetical protein
MPAFAFTIFTAAFLLFQVQPLIGKYILPWFGGGPGVWTTCLMFFQVLLLGGYAYAHFMTRWLRPRIQVITHVVLLAAAVSLLPITPSEGWKPRGEGNPTLQILALLTSSLGVQYFVLASTGPLLQHWFSRTRPGRSPYRLYALSNTGSLLALLSYPFFVESHFTRSLQVRFWCWGLVIYAVACALCAVKSKVQSPKSKVQNPESTVRGPQSTVNGPKSEVQSPKSSDPGSASSALRPSALSLCLWLLLPACASILLMAITNKLCQDIAAVPFLWVIPLALYLLSFIICFDSPRWYVRFPFTLALIAALAGISWALFFGSDLSVYKQMAIYCAGLFVCCMVCHGELYRLRSDPSHLTMFYLLIAAGGALGGFLVAGVAPLVFKDYYELNCGLWFCGLLFFVVCATTKPVHGPQGTGESPKSLVSSLKSQVAGAQSMAPPSGSGVVEAESSEFKVQGSRFKVPHVLLGVWRSLANPAHEWCWMGCTLPVLVFVGLDRFFARFGQELGSAPNQNFLVLRVAVWGLLLVLIASWFARGKFRNFRYWHGLACAWLLLGLVALGVALWMQGIKSGTGVVYMSRNFYGVLTVYEYLPNDPKSHYFLLRHGRITHGLQFVDPEEARWPTAYYGEDSGIGLALQSLPSPPRRIGLVGLGTGTLTSYSRPGDTVRVYEINPEVYRLATNRFSYLTQADGKIDVVLGDARLSLERESPQQFDLLALDAFSSDAIPVHLLTRQAFELYQRHVKTNGIIAVHISNHYLDLEPVVANLAREFHYRMTLVDYDETVDEWWLYPSTWALLSHDETMLTLPELSFGARLVSPKAPKVPLWTDDFTSLFQILK